MSSSTIQEIAGQSCDNSSDPHVLGPSIECEMQSEEEDDEDFSDLLDILLGNTPITTFSPNQQDISELTLDEYFKHKHQLAVVRYKQKLDAYRDAVLLAQTPQDFETLVKIVDKKEEQEGEERFLAIRRRAKFLQDKWSEEDSRREPLLPTSVASESTGSTYVKVRIPFDEEDTALYFPRLVRSRTITTPTLNGQISENGDGKLRQNGEKVDLGIVEDKSPSCWRNFFKQINCFHP